MISGQKPPWALRTRALPIHDRVLVMGILNITPDSFSDGGRYFSIDEAVARGMSIEAEGADLLDIGGESSRPGSQPVSLEDELDRVIPVLSRLAGRLRIPISVDTTKAEVARRSLDLGAETINDVSALTHDPHMAEVIARYRAGLIVMHMQGVPATMQEKPFYTDIVEELTQFFRQRIEAAVAAGIELNRIAIDPGLGFGKRLEDNLTVLGKLSSFLGLGHPIVIGPSRKGFLGTLLNRHVEEREWGTAAAVACSVLNGADVVRVHSVTEMRDVVRVSHAIRTAVGIPGSCKAMGTA
jgi:dihydropteroate synthase